MLSRQVKARIRANKNRRRYRYKVTGIRFLEEDVSVMPAGTPVFFICSAKGPTGLNVVKRDGLVDSFNVHKVADLAKWIEEPTPGHILELRDAK